MPHGALSGLPHASCHNWPQLAPLDQVMRWRAKAMAVRETSTGVEFPPEIWLHVAKYLPSDALQRLRTVNRALYEAAMDDRYSRMYLCAYDMDTARNIELIKYPYVAGRVRKFHISPFTVEDLVSLERTFHLSPHLSPNRARKDSTERLLDRLRPLWSSSNDTQNSNPRMDSTESMTRSVMESVKGFVNVEEYNINWGGDSSIPFDLPLVNAGWPVFGQNLRRVSIRYPLDRFSAMFPPPVDLSNLHDLNLDYCMPSSTFTEDPAPLLKSLASSLRSVVTIRSLRLTIATRVSFNVSPFFTSLPVFPRLQTFCIQVPFIRECLADPSALADFINRHQLTLQHLTLNLDHHHGYMNVQDEVFYQTVSPLLSIHLLSLELYIGLLSADTVSKCIEPFSKTLTSLVLLEQGLEYYQTRLIISTFTPHNRLTVLALCVSSFTPLILDLLADNLPSLKKLCITAVTIDPKPFYNGTRIYTEWKDLTSLWISHFSPRLAAWSLMIYLANYRIPTIRECDGHPVWVNRCECAIITIDSLRDALNELGGPRQNHARDADDGVAFKLARRFQVLPYACDAHCLKFYTPPTKNASLS